MSSAKLRNSLKFGKTMTVEYSNFDNELNPSIFETICAFLNRNGGDIYLGIDDDGTVSGIPEELVDDTMKQLNKLLNTTDFLSPSFDLSPEVIEYEEKKVIRIFIAPSADIHSYKNAIYDRIGHANIRITAPSQIAAFYIRKQKIYTEKRIYPYVQLEHLRLDLLPRIKQMAVNYNKDHPWKNMTDIELLHNAGLIGEDLEIGKKGFNFAAIMLLGKDEIIRSVSSVYRTDAIVRKVNIDRYDDRIIVQTNLVESYEQLMQFAEKHLWDKFFLDGDVRINLRNVIARELLVNTLIHRDFFSDYIAKFIIEKERMFIENANHTINNTVISLENFQPTPKNPIIASFFRNIGLADELGSGVRNLYHYSRRYSGKDPELIDGDVFRIIIPLNEEYSLESKSQNSKEVFFCGVCCSSDEIAVINILQHNPSVLQQEIADTLGKSIRTIQMIITKLKNKGLVEHEGSRKKGKWAVKTE